MTETDREAFEQWLRDSQMLDATWDEKRNCYQEFSAHLAWQAWQAAKASATAKPKKTILYTQEQAAEFLSVSPQTLANWRATGRYALPYIKVGRLVKYRKTDLVAFLNENQKG